MTEDLSKSEFYKKYAYVGEAKFYRFLLCYGVNKIVKVEKDETFISPEIELLELSNKFLFSYRRQSNLEFLEISKLLRKAANKIYRMMLKKDLTNHNNKFFNLVKNGSCN